MENQGLKLFAILFLLGISGCEKIDVGSMFVSYETVNERFEDSMDWNSQNPFRELVTTEKEYVLFAMGDSHVGGVENLNVFIDDAKSSNALAIVAVGDLATGKAEDFQVYQDNIAKAHPVEVFNIVGNHDLYFNGWQEFYNRFGSSVYYFTVKTAEASDLFICLDTGSGTMGSKQIKWLRELLEIKRDDFRHCVVFTHNNFFKSRKTATTTPLVEELYVLMDLFLTYQVDLVVTGHDHKKSTETLGNTTYIIMDALMDGFRDPGYLKIEISEEGVNFEFVNI